MITPQIEMPLYAAINAKCKELKCDPLAIGGEDHVHLFTRFPTTLSIATLVKEVKGASSHLITHPIVPNDFFKWQGAYGAFTVSKSVADQVCDYILNQKKHHSENSLFADWEKCETEDI